MPLTIDSRGVGGLAGIDVPGVPMRQMLFRVRHYRIAGRIAFPIVINAPAACTGATTIRSSPAGQLLIIVAFTYRDRQRRGLDPSPERTIETSTYAGSTGLQLPARCTTDVWKTGQASTR